MKYLSLALFLSIIFLIPTSQAFGQADFAITTPEEGSAVLGKVEIRGYIKATNFTGYDLDFSHNTTADAGWFNIQTSNQNPADGLLGFWDTSSISDGNYRLRLTVHYKDASKAEVFVENIRVRNYSMIETDTPAPGNTPVPTQDTSLRPTFQVPELIGGTPGKNDIEIGQADLQMTVAISLGAGLVLVVLIAYIFIKRNQ